MHKSQGTWSEGLGQIGETDEVFTLNSQQRIDIGCRKWSSQCGVVHPDFKSHVNRTVTLKGDKGSAINISAKQKLNTESSAMAKLVGVDYALPLASWVPLFLKEQGHKVKENVIKQDNESAILLANNGKAFGQMDMGN